MKPLIFALLGAQCLSTVRAEVAVLTQHNDLSRSGTDLQETVLNTANVSANQFGLLYSRAVDDEIYAQPFIMTHLDIPGKGLRHVLFVATVNDSVYAFDAADSFLNAPYRQLSFTNANVVPPRNTDATGACAGNWSNCQRQPGHRQHAGY